MVSVRVQYHSSSESDVEEDDYIGNDMGNEADKTKEEISASDADNTLEENLKNGIADVMARILGKTLPKNKNPILARGQTDREIERRKRKKGKREGVEKKNKKKEDSSSDETDSPLSPHTYHQKMQKRKELEEKGRVKPNTLDKEKEKSLQRIATRGVVQLFNAVRQQQDILGDKLKEAGPSVRRRDRVKGSVNKKSFLDLLDAKKPTAVAPSKTHLEKRQKTMAESESQSTWSILRDDFLMGARMKDWDKDSSDVDDGVAHS